MSWPCTPQRNGAHQFDALSGYCIHGCGVRDDGHVVSREGKVLAAGQQYSPAELSYLADRAAKIIRGRKLVGK
ncbi:hypothetical protein [Glaciibacter flavus]|uniref:hypothetical protein n=1 Tax=Orlajensenia flava TaxID=2565934 RepID=UPI003AFFF76B